MEFLRRAESGLVVGTLWNAESLCAGAGGATRQRGNYVEMQL